MLVWNEVHESMAKVMGDWNRVWRLTLIENCHTAWQVLYGDVVKLDSGEKIGMTRSG